MPASSSSRLLYVVSDIVWLFINIYISLSRWGVKVAKRGRLWAYIGHCIGVSLFYVWGNYCHRSQKIIFSLNSDLYVSVAQSKKWLWYGVLPCGGITIVASKYFPIPNNIRNNSPWLGMILPKMGTCFMRNCWPRVSSSLSWRLTVSQCVLSALEMLGEFVCIYVNIHTAPIEI